MTLLCKLTPKDGLGHSFSLTTDFARPNAYITVLWRQRLGIGLKYKPIRSEAVLASRAGPLPPVARDCVLRKRRPFDGIRRAAAKRAFDPLCRVSYAEDFAGICGNVGPP